MKLKERVSIVIIKIGRRLFYNTPVQRWGITSLLYDTIFHAGYSEKELSTTYFGAKLTFPGKDFTITPGLMGGFYEKRELEIFQAVCGVSKRVVDVGGNIGLYSVIAGNAGCVVDVFEPVPENYEFLERNIIDNNLQKQITLIKKAVSSSPGTANIFLSQKNIGTHSLSSHAAESTKALEVDVVTIDDTIKRQSSVDILKIDVEGYDGYVLDGAKKLIASSKPTLFIELVPKHLLAAKYNPIDFVKIISKGYKHIYIVDEVSETVAKVKKDVLLNYINANKSANIIAAEQNVHVDVLEKFLTNN